MPMECLSDSISTVALTDSLFKPLRPWQTRLLQIHPDEPSSPISAKVLVVNLVVIEGVAVQDTNEIVGYDALSYTWGTSSAAESIILNGVPHAITSQLRSALLQYRRGLIGRVGNLWIDAVCINQADEMEKSVQVAMMLQIFQKARLVWIWLGPSTDDSDRAMDFIMRLNDDVNPSESEIASLGVLYMRKWLRRTWIRQEVFAARAITVNCGNKCANWRNFIEAGQMLPIWDFDSSQISRGTTEIALVLEDLAKSGPSPLQLASKPPRQLSEVLLASRHFEVTKPHDRVYAILGMTGVYVSRLGGDISGEHPNTMTVNYYKSPAQVYTDLARYLIDTEGRDRAFSTLFHYTKSHVEESNIEPTIAPRGTPCLPSWVSDWHSTCYSLQDLETTTPPPSYFLDKRSTAPMDLENVLTTKALHTDTIKSNELLLLGHFVATVDMVYSFTCSPMIFLAWAKSGDHGITSFLNLVLMKDDLTCHRPCGRVNESFGRRGLKVRCALLPAAARSGDIVVTVSRSVLPILVRPVRGVLDSGQDLDWRPRSVAVALGDVDSCYKQSLRCRFVGPVFIAWDHYWPDDTGVRLDGSPVVSIPEVPQNPTRFMRRATDLGVNESKYALGAVPISILLI